MSADVLEPLTLVVGTRSCGRPRRVGRRTRRARDAEPGADVPDVAAEELERGDLDDLLKPSLSGERRVLVVRTAQATHILLALISIELCFLLINDCGWRHQRWQQWTTTAALDAVVRRRR